MTNNLLILAMILLWQLIAILVAWTLARHTKLSETQVTLVSLLWPIAVIVTLVGGPIVISAEITARTIKNARKNH